LKFEIAKYKQTCFIYT